MDASNRELRSLRLIIEYDGSELCGWQRQASDLTVQGLLEAAAENLFGAPHAIAGASRTDAGVHARGQVALLRTFSTIPEKGIRHALNQRLPTSVVVRDVTAVDANFHPRFSATGKWYRYTIWTGDNRAPRWERRAWQRRGPLDLGAMRAAAALLEGEHDFASFRTVGCISKSTRRYMERIEVTESEPSVVLVDVRGNAFLRNMVRIMVGTIAEVGAGRRELAAVTHALAAGRRETAGITAPAEGLELMEVRYDGVRRGTLAPT